MELKTNTGAAVAVSDVAFVDLKELESLEGFNEELAQELQKRAQKFLEEEARQKMEQWSSLGGQDDLKVLSELLTPDCLLTLAKAKVLTLQDFADLASDELLEIVGKELAANQADRLILEARDRLSGGEKPSRG